VKTFCRFAVLLIAAAALVESQDLKEFEKKVKEFTLANGLHFVVVERHEAPVVSFHTYVNAGSIDDPAGETGLAHMFEHMAFKGTETIGSKDWAAEKAAMETVESIYDQLEAERNKGPRADQGRVHLLETKLKLAIDDAQSYVKPNEYSRIIEENGGVGLNASTGLTGTEYFYSLPSNRMELWFLMESQRFLHPVFREFYKEREVVAEEHRMRVESNPQGMLLQTFLAAAFEAFPYRNPPGGWPSDIANLRRSEAEEFFAKYYVPGNISMAIVGDVDPQEAQGLAERYFGPMPSRPLPRAIHTEEPPQPGPATAVVGSPSQPLIVIGYKRPDQYDKDDPALDVLSVILSSGRTAVLYRELVEQKRLALAAEAVATYPDGRYPNLFLFFLAPVVGRTIEEDRNALADLLTRFEAKPVDEETLARAKTKLRAHVIRRLDNNAGLASLLNTYYANYGDWRKLFRSVEEYNQVTAADVQRLAFQYFVAQNRTDCYIAAPSPAAARPAGAPGGRP
jgi:predicted Zn-dependent peptidase